MAESRAGIPLARLVKSVLSVKPLVGGAAGPIHVVPVAPGRGATPVSLSRRECDGVTRLLDRVAALTGVAGLTVSRDATLGDLGVVEREVSHRLALAELVGTAWQAGAQTELERIVAETMADSFDVVFHKDSTRSLDGLPLTVYGAGAGEAVVVVPACGMPAALAERWMRFLARDRLVVSWESRGMFGTSDPPADYAVDTAAQAFDLLTVMDHFGVGTAHVVGLCGGAVIALAAAARAPDRIRALSLWHGAYQLDSGSPRTTFQNDLIELMLLAAGSPAAARSVQAALCQVALTSTPADLAHLVLYPYASPDLFYRYCRLNGTLARTDVEQYLSKVEQPTLVVTSEDDQTAHPHGSRLVADGLPNGRLHVESHGDHLSLFHAEDSLMQVAADFMAQARPA